MSSLPNSRRCITSTQWITSVVHCLVLLLSLSCLPLSSAASLTFLSNQPANYTTIPATSTSVSFSLLYSYTDTTLVVYTNATTLTATLSNGGNGGTITQLPVNQSDSFLPYSNTSVLVLPLTLNPSAAYQSFLSACRTADLLNQTVPAGYCNITFTLHAEATTTVAYSLYYIPQISLSTAYTSQLATDAWQYYSLWITYEQLNVLFTLSPSVVNVQGNTGSPNVDLWLSAVSSSTSPLVPIFPTNSTGSYRYTHTGGVEAVMLNSDGGFEDGLYIVGVHAPVSTNGVSGYTLLLQGGVSGYGSSSGGVEVSMFAIVGALVVLVLCLFSAAALIARRRRSYIRDLHLFDTPAAQLELMHRIQIRALADGRVVAVGPTADVYHGATDSQIGRLPTHVYVDGEMSAEDAKCTICLDEFIAGESTLKVLHCGHVYHEQCITTWLHTRKHCPLCLQNVDSAHDVAKHDDSKPAVDPTTAAGRAVAAVTAVTTSSGSEDGVKMEVSAAAAPSSTVVDSAGSDRRSSSGREEGTTAVELPHTPHSSRDEERKEQQ